jgi:anti-sigma regulatory factor (Ser/Thr protein kinase)
MPIRSDQLTVPGTPDGVGRAIEAFGRFTQANALPDEVRRDGQLALDEVLSNVVRHGLAGRTGTISVRYAVKDDELSIEVVDDAPAFNPLAAPAPDTGAPLEARTPGGLGIALVAAILDDVRYERRDDRNHLMMKRRITP